MKAIVIDTFQITQNNYQVDYAIYDGSGVYQNGFAPTYAVNNKTTAPAIQATMIATIVADAAVQGYTIAPSDVIGPWTLLSDVSALIAAAAPASYQTIVSQTGTAIPAVAGGMTPMNSYAGAPTFTWARSGVGVYTLTASSAVFNTSGKTGVFIAPLQNLNASAKAVITSSTVITITTAVQAVAILGLLGLTATPTDALLSGTMVYVQTYP